MAAPALVRTAPVPERSCSCCGRAEHEAAVLLAATSFLICDECVDTMAGILVGKLGAAALPETKALLAEAA